MMVIPSAFLELVRHLLSVTSCNHPCTVSQAQAITRIGVHVCVFVAICLTQ